VTLKSRLGVTGNSTVQEIAYEFMLALLRSNCGPNLHCFRDKAIILVENRGYFSHPSFYTATPAENCCRYFRHYRAMLCITLIMPSQTLSVCLSVTRRYCVETAKHILKLFPPSGSNTTLVFCSKPCGNIPTGTPLTEARGHEKIAIFDRFISEMIKDRAIVTMECV